MYTYGDCPRSFGMRSTLAVRMLGGARASSSVAAGDARQLLAPHGVLRAAINFANPLLVSGRGPKGIEGVAPSMAAALADRLSVPLELVVFPNPGSLGDAAPTGEWDVGLIGAEPQRAKLISFSKPYVELEATYLVPRSSPVHKCEEVDRVGNRIVVSARSAYDLWLTNNIKHAQIVRTEKPGLERSLAHFEKTQRVC